MTDTFDLVVLGGGSGGYAAALRAAQLGSSVALVERDRLGGTCLHTGCIPTKALLHAAEVADASRDAAAYGVRATFDGIDLPAVNRYRDGVVKRLHQGLEGLVKGAGITVVDGSGHLVGPTTVEVGGRRVVGTDLVLATGSYARTIPGLELGPRVVTSEAALRLETVPDRAETGTIVSMEFMPFSTIATLAAGLDVVERADHPNAGLMVDLWHLQRSGATYDELAAVPLSRVTGVELSDAAAEQVGTGLEDTVLRRRLCGEGDFDIAGFVATMRAMGWDGPWGLEILSETYRRRPLVEAVRDAYLTTAPYLA